MNNFCPYCGAPYTEGSAFCTQCGRKRENAPQQAAPQQYAPNPAAPRAHKPQSLKAGDLAGYFRQYMRVILVVMVAFSLIIAVMNLFATYDVKLTAKFMGASRSEYGPLKDVRSSGEATMYAMHTWVLGISALAGAILGGLALLKLSKNEAGSKQCVDLAVYITGGGVVAAILLGLFGNTMEAYGVSAKLSMHFTTWLYAIITFTVDVAYQLLLQKKDASPLK